MPNGVRHGQKLGNQLHIRLARGDCKLARVVPVHSRPVDQHCWYTIGEGCKQLVSVGEGTNRRRTKGIMGKLEGVCSGDYRSFLKNY